MVQYKEMVLSGADCIELLDKYVNFIVSKLPFEVDVTVSGTARHLVASSKYNATVKITVSIYSNAEGTSLGASMNNKYTDIPTSLSDGVYSTTVSYYEGENYFEFGVYKYNAYATGITMFGYFDKDVSIGFCNVVINQGSVFGTESTTIYANRDTAPKLEAYMNFNINQSAYPQAMILMPYLLRDGTKLKNLYAANKSDTTFSTSDGDYTYLRGNGGLYVKLK